MVGTTYACGLIKRPEQACRAFYTSAFSQEVVFLALTLVVGVVVFEKGERATAVFTDCIESAVSRTFLAHVVEIDELLAWVALTVHAQHV